MKVGVYSKEADSESIHENELLAREIQSLGHEYVLINYGDGRHVVSPNKRKLYAVEGFKKTEITSNDMDVVIPRINEAEIDEVLLAVSGLRGLVAAGIPSVNSPDAISLAKDKFAALWQLEANGINTNETLMPTTAEVASSEEMLNAIEPVPKNRVVIKTNFGTTGKGAIVQPNRRYAKSVLDSIPGPVLLQRFVGTPGYPKAVSDVRVVVVGNETISYGRKAKGDLRSNVYRPNAGKVTDYTATLKEIDLAVKSTRALGLDAGGVDIYQLIKKIPLVRYWLKTGSLEVGEVNASSGFGKGEELEKAVCSAFVRFAIQKAIDAK